MSMTEICTSRAHPRIEGAERLRQADRSAAELGYRMPAEWEPVARVWVDPPHNPETWPLCLEEAQKEFQQFVEAVSRAARVVNIKDLGIPTVDSWIRDYGPIFVKKDSGGKDAIAVHDFRFNGWGGKYENRDLDDVVPQHIALKENRLIWIHDMVLEGGSIDVNGRGTVLTTQQCLLNPNRNPHLSREQIEQALHAALGTRHVIWLPGGIVGDDTDGHVDDIARFVAPDRVVCVRARQGHPDHAVLEENYRALRAARDQDGRKLEVVELPAPEPMRYRFPPDRFGPGGELPVPASYANFLMVNGWVFVPVFGQKSDDQALRILEQAMPGYRIVGLEARHLVVGLGAFHCLSQQEPVASDQAGL